ncbi:SDR family oxidoreductase [Bacteriovorax sp. PP10]|uniref:SDR family oxidoreductase n=1 Tax=Bacteriovorax antarcticus TaxID=3088717 RepID=A0ABU5VW84_9BACT|nr:SDR family oxidoreductase [Bacteriovorax sp. PP10]MEA9357324.1 SDR family oxidoreductase [Bacteriovorax sp. PP10]
MTIKNSTVVIMGASSGIGHGTALAFAKEGANVVLASRNEGTLKDVAKECEKFGAKTLVVETDVTDADSVLELARKAANAFNGRIDVWVNDAGVGAIGNYEIVPMDSHAQVVAVNLMGYMHGTHAVLPYFKKQRSGTIINMNSIGAYIPSAYSASYTASKFGLRGFMDAIRAEFREWPDIHICDVFPGFVGSPGMKHGANYVGVEMKPMHPVISAHRVADEIVELAKNPKNKQLIGLTARVAKFIGNLAPESSANSLARVMEHHFKNGKRAPIDDGTLFSPTPASTSQIEGSYNHIKRNTMIVGGVCAVAAGAYLAWKMNHSLQSSPSNRQLQ